MRRTRTAVGLALLLACSAVRAATADGDKDPLAFPFTSKAHAPEGEPIRLVFAPHAGDVYEEKVVESGTVTVPTFDGSTKKSVSTSMTFVHRCTEVRDDGLRMMTSEVESAEGTDDPALIDALLRVRVTWAADRFGVVKSEKARGGTDRAQAKVMGRLFQPGNRVFLAFPEAGVRVGQALDYFQMFDPGDVRGSLLSIPDAPAPQAKSEAVLLRRTTVADEPAAEFALNAVAYAAADLPDQNARMESASRYTGSLFISTATGFPVGRMEIRLEGRVGVVREGTRFVTSRDIRATHEFKKRPSEH
jgi:hypothetical protein